MSTDRDVAATLVALRSAQRLTQRDLARLADIHHTQISRYESGLELPSSRTLLRLMEALAVTPKEFYSMEDLLRRAVARRRGEAGSTTTLEETGRDDETKALAEEAGRLLSRAVEMHFRRLDRG
ncbi:MAG: helix-turn-helix transcriptional regulator [Thermoanaerobaculia bacterium]|nr:helix-turn-helix transcriptional regulator [Thermoanaerobaculia bacterium]